MITEIVALILLVSYREVGILCDRGSWVWVRFQNVFWKTDQNNLWVKNLDWFHVSNGLATLIICWMFAKTYTVIDLGEYSRYLNTVIFWGLWMYVRNIFIHIVIPLPKFRRYWFAVPFGGAFLDRKYKRR